MTQKTKAQELIEGLTQYADHGGSRTPTTPTVQTLEAGIYRIFMTMKGPVFERHHMVTDELLKFDDERQNRVLQEVADFWTLRDKFKALGMTHKRGMLLTGAPGSGKSCILKLVMNDIVERGDLVFLGSDPQDIRACLKAFRQVEPERRAILMIEDLDEVVRYGERTMLEMMDGDDQVDGVLFLGTTNYPERLNPRMLRAGRFDRKIEIPFPPKAGRLAYLQKKIGVHETEDPTVLEDIADATDGFSFAQLREFLVSVYVYGYDPEETISRLQLGGVSESYSKTPAGDLLRSMSENVSEAQILEAVYGMTKSQKDSVKKAATKRKKKINSMNGC